MTTDKENDTLLFTPENKPVAPKAEKQSRGPSKAEKAQAKIDARAELVAELRAELVPGGHCPICATKVYKEDSTFKDERLAEIKAEQEKAAK